MNYPTLDRRGFLKAGTALIGGVVLARYVEPLNLPNQEHKDWVTDKGDYYVIRVPDNKGMRKELFDKPVIMTLGENSYADGITVIGFMNVFSKNRGTLTSIKVDASGVVSEKPRAAIFCTGKDLAVIGSYFKASVNGCALVSEVKGQRIFENIIGESYDRSTKFI